MLEWIISSTALIAVIIALRFILRGKISPRLQYALWALVLVRLLLPFSIGSSSLSVMNQVEYSSTYQEMTSTVTVITPGNTLPDQTTGGNATPPLSGTQTPTVTVPGTTPSAGQTVPEQPTPPPAQEAPTPQTDKDVNIAAALRRVWLGGSILLGVWFAVTNLRFFLRLKKSRTPYATERKLPVYVCGAVDTPCLFGFFRPAVYLTEDVASDERTTRHAVEHEMTHYHHKDHIWAVLRCVCLAVHWFNPLVWYAAFLSRNDAELACDDSTIRRLGESERAEYGRTLLRLTCEKRTAILHTATTMTGSGKSIKERIALIVKKPKMAVYTLIAVLLIAAVAIACTFTGAKDRPHSFTEWTESLTVEEIQWAQASKEYGVEKIYYTVPAEEMDKLRAILCSITDDACSRKKPEGDNEDGYRLALYRADKLWLFKCLSDGTIGLMFNDAETGAYFGCEGSLLIIESPELWNYIVDTVDEKGVSKNDDDNSGDGNKTEIPEDIAYVLNLLETLKPEEVTGYSDNMQADAEIIVPLINAAAGTYAGEIEIENEWEWFVDLHLSQRSDDSGYNPETLNFCIGIREGIVDVHCRLDANADPSDYVCIRLHSEELWDYIFSLYNPDGIDQQALALYGDILAERARWRIAEHSTYLVPEGFPALTGYEITYLRLVDSFHYGYSFRVYRFDIGYLTDDPDPGRYGWPQDAGPDEQGRIRGYDSSIYFIAAHAHDDLVDYGYFQDCEAYCLPLNLRMDIVETITGEKVRLDYKRAEDGNSLYTCDGISISIPYNFEHLVEAHRDPDTWCYGLIMNPTYYLDNPYITDQALFNLFHICEYCEDGSGLIFSIRRYTEEEYQTMYLNSYSRQQVFARDDDYYYCVFIPTGTSDEDPEKAAIIAELLDQQLKKILADMIERNGWQAYNGENDGDSTLTDEQIRANAIVKNFASLKAEDIKQIPGFIGTDYSDVAVLLNDLEEYKIESFESDQSFWSLTLYLSGGPEEFNHRTDENLTIYAYGEESRLQIQYHSKLGVSTRIYFDYPALHQYIRQQYHTDHVIAEEALALYRDILTARAEYTMNVRNSNFEEAKFVDYEIMTFHQVGTFARNGMTYEVYEWEIAFITDNINYPWVMNRVWVDSELRIRSYDSYPYLVIRSDGTKKEHNFFPWDTYLGGTDFERELTYDEIAANFVPGNSIESTVETLPVLTLTDAETDTLCNAVMSNLKTGWWKGGGPLADCTYEAGAFECVWRETYEYTERLYGYAGYFRFDEAGNCVEYWYAPSIVTLNASKEVVNIWWPGDGVHYEVDIRSYFPDEIAEFVAEPNEERYQVILGRLIELAAARMIPEAPTDMEKRLSTLTAEDIKYISASIRTPSTADIVNTLGASLVNRVGHDDSTRSFWTLEFYLSGGDGGGYSSQTDEWVILYAGLEENIVEIWYHEPYSTAIQFFVEDEALYQLVRGSYATDDVIDQGAYARYSDFLNERAQETVDYSRETVNKFYPLPYTGYEIVRFEQTDSFERDGARYEVYEWDVAFLHDDPMEVGWAGGMWLDSELRVRALEQETYFVVRISGDVVEYDFFFWDLYFGPDEATGRENAIETITKRFSDSEN